MEDERSRAELHDKWLTYWACFDKAQLDKADAMFRYRKMFPLNSPEQFEKAWLTVRRITRPVPHRRRVRHEEKGLAPATLPAPPRVGEVLVGLFCKRDMREAVLGDLDEKFAELAGRRGVRVAKAWYWSQAGRSVLFFAVRWGRRLLELEAILKRLL